MKYYITVNIFICDLRLDLDKRVPFEMGSLYTISVYKIKRLLADLNMIPYMIERGPLRHS